METPAEKESLEHPELADVMEAGETKETPEGMETRVGAAIPDSREIPEPVVEPEGTVTRAEMDSKGPEGKEALAASTEWTAPRAIEVTAAIEDHVVPTDPPDTPVKADVTVTTAPRVILGQSVSRRSTSIQLNTIYVVITSRPLRHIG